MIDDGLSFYGVCRLLDGGAQTPKYNFILGNYPDIQKRQDFPPKNDGIAVPKRSDK
jgi:hypothetical protein